MAKILICTGIYPPLVGGPSQYAKVVAEEWQKAGHSVKVLTYTVERSLPAGIRHEVFFWKTLFTLIVSFRGVDFILALDTFSVGWPAATAAKIAGKKIVIRTGGDFLWESYVERTGDLVLLRDFYDTSLGKLTFKERFIYKATEWTLQNSRAVIFSTAWQRDIFTKAYNLEPLKNFIVENFYGEKAEKIASESPSKPSNIPNSRDKKIFVAGTRPLKWKNLPRLRQAFDIARKKFANIELDTKGAPYGEFMKKIHGSYAVILVSLGDISPNMILDAIRYNKPFILTEETGLYEKLKDIAIFADPKNVIDIANKIEMICDPRVYEEQKRKITAFNYTHSWKEICDEIMTIAMTGRNR